MRNLAFATLAFALCAPAHAQDLTVTAVQWVQGNDEIPHPALNGRPTLLQAIAEGGQCNGAYVYRWDINGDGDYADPNEQNRQASAGGIYNNYFAPLGIDITFPDAQGDTLRFPKVEVTCGEETASAVMPVLTRVQRICPGYPANNNCEGDQNLQLTRRWHADRAVDRALWWMFVRFNHNRNDGHGHDVHTCNFSAATPQLYGHGHALNAFLRRGHGHGEGRASDVYYRHVTQCGVHATLTTFNMVDGMFFDDINDAGINNKRVQYQNGQLGGFGHWSSYGASAWVEPVASFGDPDYVSPVGSANVVGRTLRSIGQDLADGLIHCMRGDGGWFYSCGGGGGSTNDGSTNGWAPESLRLLERKFGTETYQWAKDRQRNWLNAHCNNGTCNYHHGDARLSGNALVGYGWTEDQVFSGAGNQLAHLNSVQANNHVGLGLYYMYASTKGLRSFVPEISRLPNGRDWAAEFTDFLLQQQAGDGSWNWVGGWPWAGSVNQGSRTGMTTQIIQSWLEVSAYARATPELSGPGIDITFDHSWSYVLDPGVTMDVFRWNVIDYPDGLDLNGDEDFDDAGEHPPEDVDDSGTVELDEIVWDYETDDPNAPFVYAYDVDLGWDDIENFTVTLEVEDSAGRVVHDQDSVRIELSLRNHKPVIIPHPDGLGARYRGYIGADVLLDGRASYDPDTDVDVFPGDDERDEGTQDRVTSIHFDLNLDGDFDDEGEDGTDGTVLMNLREGQGEGDVLAVPMRVCDDGQWNGKCYDGIQRADCSECSFGSAPIQLVRNVDPPVIHLGDNPYASEGHDPVQLDLSGSSDPEGVLGLRYLYELIEGRGTFVQSELYADIDDDMGPDVTYDPDADGPRVDRIRATVIDYGGFETEGEIRVAVENIPPVVDGFDLRFRGASPVVRQLAVENRGNGRYRVSLDANPSPNVDTWVSWSGRDEGGDDLRVTVDLEDNGSIDLRADGARGEVGPHPLPGGQPVTPNLQLVDDADSTRGEPREFDVPAADPTLSFYFDLGDDGRFEVAGGGANWFEFERPPGAEQVVVAGYVRGAEGAPTEFSQEIPLQNADPVFEDARLLSQEGFDVVVSASAVDPDGDAVTYEIDWGDGSPVTRNRGGVGAHSYPDGVFRDYTITVTVTDGQSGETVREIDVSFEAPAENRPPTIAEVRVIKEGGFDVLVVVSANDPDGDRLTYDIEWGDARPDSQVFNGIAAHTYPEAFRAWGITVTVTDEHGASAEGNANVNFPAPAENRAPRVDGLQLVKEGGFRVVAVAAGSDPDADPLTYTFDWGDGSQPVQSAGGIAAHTYPDGVFRAYTVTVTVSDGALTAEGEQEVDFPRPPANRDPVVEEVRLIRQGEWELLAVVGAIDPDGDGLEFTIDWGDGSEAVVNRGGIAAHVYPENVYRAYDIVATVDDGRGGTARGEARFNFPEPADNAPPVINEVDIDVGARGQTSISVDAFDPEGRALTYRVHWGDEAGPDETTNLIGGQGVHRYELPAEDVAYEGFVIARDDLDNEARQAFQVRVADSPTIVRDLSVNVIRDGTVLVSVVAEDRDGDDFLVYSFDFTDDGDFDVVNQADSSIVHSFPEAGEYGIRVRVTDTWSGNSIEEVARVGLQPWVGENGAPVVIGAELTHGGRGRLDVAVDAWDPEGGRLTYRIHWGDEEDAGATEVLVGGFGDHRYGAPSPEDAPYAAWVDVTDVAGSTTRHAFDVAIVDRVTAVRSVSANLIREGTVLVSVLAEDGDGRDGLLYSYDFDGDGAWELEDLATDSVVHSYDDPGEYTVIVGVRDPWTGAQVQGHTDVVLAPWVAENREPVIHDLRLAHGPRGLVTLAVDASDPEGGQVDLVVHWGDEDEPDALAPFAGLGTEHRYAFQQDADAGAYAGFVRATDPQGASVQRPFMVRIVDAPTRVRAISVSHVEGGTYLFDVLADDGDGADQLRYGFDFDGDGDFEVRDAVSSSTIHGFGGPGLYTVNVSVVDTWSGAVSEAQTEVDVAPWQADNEPPVVHDIEVSVGARGLVAIVVDAEDPEGGRLNFEVHWGDEDDAEALAAMPGPAGEHVYAWRADDEDYAGRVVVTDNAGATAEGAFDVKVNDSETVIREVSVAVLRGGTILASVSAADPDSDQLVYSYDFDGDGVFDLVDTAEASAVHAFDDAGSYSMTVSVTDPWSGVSVTAEHGFELPPWDGDAPIADDHLEGEEGFCLVFRIGEDGDDLSTKVDPEACERAVNPGENLYTWDFGDGSMGRGSEVGHRYADDGIYEVVIRGGTEGRPVEVHIQVLIANVAPSFLTQPPVVAIPGEVYEYTVRLEDPGETDRVRLALEGGPEGMTVTPSIDSDRRWTVRWDVPEDFDTRQVEVVLRAIDGHGGADAWTQDGGDTLQAFFLTLGGTGGNGGSGNGDDTDGGMADAGDTADGGLGLDEFTGSSCACDATQGPGFGLFLFLGVLALGRRRRER